MEIKIEEQIGSWGTFQKLADDRRQIGMKTPPPVTVLNVRGFMVGKQVSTFMSFIYRYTLYGSFYIVYLSPYTKP